MMKNYLIKILQSILGYSTYLKIFSMTKIYTLRLSRTKADFLVFKNMIGKDANILVIGACTGITTIPLARKNKSAKIFAYEPQCSNFNVLNWTIKRFNLNNVHTYNIGFGNKAGKRELILPVVDGIRKQGFAHVIDPSINEYNQGIIEEVDIHRIDDRRELNGIKIHGVKIVAQNFEKQILEGACNLIATNHPIIYCEVWTEDKRKPVLDLIREYGYQVYCIENGEFKIQHKTNYSGEKFFFKYGES